MSLVRRPPTSRLARRAFAASCAAALLLGPSTGSQAAPEPRPERVVLVVFGGGVRSKDMLGRPDLCPTVRAIGAAGISSEGWRTGGTDPVRGAEAILRGRDTPDFGQPERSASPTLFEYARKGLGLAASDVWLASFADGEALDLAASRHAEYGPAFGASIAGGDGPFGELMKPLLARFGRPNPTSARSWTLLESMRAASRREAARRGGSASASGSAPADATAEAAEASRLERALLEEVDRRSRDFSGPAGLDARAVRAAITVLRVFRPRLLVVRLGQAAVAPDEAVYEEVLRRDDAEIARLRAEIAGDPALRTSTTLLVVADVGRAAPRAAPAGGGRDDGSPDATTVALVGEGPGLRRGAAARSPRAVRDLCPTIGRLLGFPTPLAEGIARDDLVR